MPPIHGVFIGIAAAELDAEELAAAAEDEAADIALLTEELALDKAALEAADAEDPEVVMVLLIVPVLVIPLVVDPLTVAEAEATVPGVAPGAQVAAFGRSLMPWPAQSESANVIVAFWSAASQTLPTQHARLAIKLESLQMHFTSN